MVPTGTSHNIVATHVHDIAENMHATNYNDCRFFQVYIYDTYSSDQHAQYLVPKEMPSLFSPHYFCLPCYAVSSDASLCLFILPAAFSSFAV